MGNLFSKCIPDDQVEDPYNKSPNEKQPLEQVPSTQSNSEKPATANGIAPANGNPTKTKNAEIGASKPKDDSRLKPIKYEYDMNHKHRGLAIIINQYIFDHGLQLGQRKGTIKDCNDLKSTFECLGFTVQMHHDLRLNQVYDVLRKVSESDHSDNDCLVVVALTHGEIVPFIHKETREESHTILAHDQLNYIFARDAKYPVQKLFSFFTDDACPTLIGKPRMFFIQACQGNNVDSGFKLYKRSTQTETDNIGFEPLEMEPALPHKDFLVVYSSFPGYFSMRNSEHGSWFIQALCRELVDRKNMHYHMLQILTFVNQSIAYDYESQTLNIDFDKKKQILCIKSMLTSIIFLREKRPSSD